MKRGGPLLLDIESSRFYVSPRFLLRSAVSFSIYPRRLLSLFVSLELEDPTTAANGFARIQQIKRNFVSPRVSSPSVGGRGGGLINGLLAEGGCITGEKKISREKTGGTGERYDAL